MKAVAYCVNESGKAKKVEREITLTIGTSYGEKATQPLCPYCGDLVKIRLVKDEAVKKAS